MKTVEFYFDIVCPYAYLASRVLDAEAARAGARVAYKPFLLGGLLRSLGREGGAATAVAPARARIDAADLLRWSDYWNVPLRFPEGHPRRTVLALRAMLASKDLPRAAHALFHAYWSEGRDVSEPAVVASALTQAGFDGGALVARASSDAGLKEELRERTDEAVARGVFGAPTFFVDEQMFWGQDRLDFVTEALGLPPVGSTLGERPPAGGASFEFWYDFSSPFSYLASTQVTQLALRNGARVSYRPFLLGGLFRAIGTPLVPLEKATPARMVYQRMELERFARRYGVPFAFAPTFPMSSVKALRVALAAPPEALPRLTDAFFRIAWVNGGDLTSDAELGGALESVGLSASLVEDASKEPAKQRLREATDEALGLGLCGAPTLRIGDELFWGQDRLMFAERALHGWHTTPR